MINSQRPYLALEPFEEEHQNYFYGRDNEILTLKNHIENNRVTILYGKSGLGKTSLLLAGVFPELRNKLFLPIYLRPNYHRQSSVITKIKQDIFDELIKIDPDIAQFKRISIWEYLQKIKILGGRVIPVLVFDQFEEIFTLGSKKTNIAIWEELGNLIENRIPLSVQDKYTGKNIPYDTTRENYRIVISLREDFLPDLESQSEDIPSILTNKFRLRQMDGQQALDAIYKPAKNIISIANAKSLLKKVIKASNNKNISKINEQTLSDYDVEPSLLSLICWKVNENRFDSNGKIKHKRINDDIINKANITDILRSHLAKQTDDLNEKQKEDLAKHFLSSDGNTRIQKFKDDLIKETTLDDVTIENLVKRRILRKSHWDKKQYVELIHDTLVKPLKEWRELMTKRNDEAIQILNKGIEKLIHGDNDQAQKHYDKFKKLSSSILDSRFIGQSIEQWCFYEWQLIERNIISNESASENFQKIQPILNKFDEAIRIYRDIKDSFGEKRIQKHQSDIRGNYEPWGYLTNLRTGIIYELSGKRIEFGRNTPNISNDINVPYQLISRRHFLFQRVENDSTDNNSGHNKEKSFFDTSEKIVKIEDNRSLNGTTLNGKDLYYGLSCKLNDKDLIVMAGLEAFEFHLLKPRYDIYLRPANSWGLFIFNQSRNLTQEDQKWDKQLLTESSYSIYLDNHGNLTLQPEGEVQDLMVMEFKKSPKMIYSTSLNFYKDLESNWQKTIQLLISGFQDQGIHLSPDIEFQEDSENKKYYLLDYLNYNKFEIKEEDEELRFYYSGAQMRLQENEWEVVYINKLERNPDLKYRLPKDQWMDLINYPMECALIKPTGKENIIQESGPSFQIVEFIEKEFWKDDIDTQQ